MKKPSALEFAILGLVRGGVPTGYAVSQVFAETPLSSFSPSPGSVYPAVKRLLKAGRLEEVLHPGDQRALRVTSEGEDAFMAWLRSPVTRTDVEREMETVFLRLAFMSGALSSIEITRFLGQLQVELAAQSERLTLYAEQMSERMSVSSALSLGAGLARVRAYALWAGQAVETLAEHSDAPEVDQ